MSVHYNPTSAVRANEWEGKSSNPSEPEEQTLAGRLVRWIRADRPFYQQVIIYSSVAISTLALTLSCAGIYLVAQLAEENTKQAKDERLKKLDEPIIDLLGGTKVHNSLPTLYFDERDATLPSSLPQLKEMRASIMKGSDRYQRPVLCFRIYDKTRQVSFVEMIYRKYSREEGDNPWITNPHEHSIFDGALVMRGSALTRLHHVIEGNDARFKLG